MSARVQSQKGALREGATASFLYTLHRTGHSEVSLSETLGLLAQHREVQSALECWLVVHASIPAVERAVRESEVMCSSMMGAGNYEGEMATAYVSAPSSREFVAIAQWCDDTYDVEDYAAVLGYLNRYPELTLPLRQIPDRTMSLCGSQRRPRLRMVIEDDSVENAFLVAAVPTMLDVSVASRILDDVDEEWWLDQSRRVSGRLVLTVDYL